MSQDKTRSLSTTRRGSPLGQYEIDFDAAERASDRPRGLTSVNTGRLSGSNLREHVAWPQVGGGWALDRA
jgi:hypothetical protein